MRHPVPYAVTVSLVLILLAIPFFQLNLGLSDDRVGPKDMSSRVATDQYRKNFASREADALSVTSPASTREGPTRQSTPSRASSRASRASHASTRSTGEYLVVDKRVVAIPPICGSRSGSGPRRAARHVPLGRARHRTLVESRRAAGRATSAPLPRRSTSPLPGSRRGSSTRRSRHQPSAAGARRSSRSRPSCCCS